MSTGLDPEVISSLWTPSDPQVSPDGRRVAWTAALSGQEGEHREQSIWVADVGGAEPGRRWTRGAEDTSPRWSPDGGRLAFLSDRAERGTQGLHVLGVDGGESRPLVERKRAVAAFAWSPDGARLAFLAPDEPTDDDERRESERDDAQVWGDDWHLQRLWVVPVDGGEPERLWAPNRHLSALAWSRDGGRIALLACDGPLAEHAMTTRVAVVVPGRDGVILGAFPGAREIGWGDGDTVVLAGYHEQLPQSGSTVWAVPADGGVPRVVGSGPDEPRCTLAVATSPDGARTLVRVAEGLDDRLEWVDVGTGERSHAADVPGVALGMSVTTVGADPVVALAVDDTGLAGVVMAGPPHDLRVVSDHGAGLPDVELGAVEPLRCPATDGLELESVVIRPAGGGEGPWPTAVLVHGGPYGRAGLSAHAHPLDWGQLLATRGYAVVLPNYRGGYGHGNAFATGARGDMGGAEWDDVLAVVDAAVAAGIADPDRLGIGGWSQGGFLTAWAVTATDRFKVGVMGAGVSDWSMMAATSDLPDFEAALGGSRPWDGPGPHHAALGSPISYAARRTTPLLILHGEQDQRVPLSQAVAFHRALAGQEAPLTLVTYPREPHGVRERAHQVDLQRRVVEWFDRHVR